LCQKYCSRIGHSIPQGITFLLQGTGLISITILRGWHDYSNEHD
jgi:hypothetical protein